MTWFVDMVWGSVQCSQTSLLTMVLPSVWLSCCCLSASICCRVKKGFLRLLTGSSGLDSHHFSKASGWRHCMCRRRFFLCLVMKWHMSQQNGFSPEEHRSQQLARYIAAEITSTTYLSCYPCSNSPKLKNCTPGTGTTMFRVSKIL